MPVKEFFEWYVHFYEIAPATKKNKPPVIAKTPEEEIAFLKAQFS